MTEKGDGAGAAGKDKYLLSSLNNALQVLETLSHYDSLSLAELARATGFDKASLFRMTYTLEKNGLVAKDADARYSLGLRLLRYGSIVAARQDIIAVARPLMQEFCRTTHLASHLGRRSRDRVVTVHIENPVSDIQVTARVGMSAPLYSTAMGRAILANLPADELDALSEGFSFKRYSENSVTSASELRELLDRTRCEGVAADVNDRYQGFGALAAPVFDHTGSCVAAVGLVTMAADVEAHHAEYAKALLELAPRISAALGCA